MTEAQFFVQRQGGRELGIGQQFDAVRTQLAGLGNDGLAEQLANAQTLGAGRHGHFRQLVYACVLLD